ncbi:hypothetical protein T492DRAFT_875107 [Pavlovales sp. CCMP2436]|nr:hypothetical protein T492DRAFT_875107 [Pavlovales sp. CCMP2436]
MGLFVVIALCAGAYTRAGPRAASRMCAAQAPERGAANRRDLLRDATGLALGVALGGASLPLPALGAMSGGIRAASQGAQVNKDPQSLLRLGLPIDCPAARAVQSELEGLKGNAQKSLW